LSFDESNSSFERWEIPLKKYPKYYEEFEWLKFWTSVTLIVYDWENTLLVIKTNNKIGNSFFIFFNL
jgi:hypothetical protein